MLKVPQITEVVERFFLPRPLDLVVVGLWFDPFIYANNFLLPKGDCFSLSTLSRGYSIIYNDLSSF